MRGTQHCNSILNGPIQSQAESSKAQGELWTCKGVKLWKKNTIFRREKGVNSIGLVPSWTYLFIWNRTCAIISLMGSLWIEPSAVCYPFCLLKKLDNLWKKIDVPSGGESETIENSNTRINLTRISRVRFWALLIARAGYANRYVHSKTLLRR